MAIAVVIAGQPAAAQEVTLLAAGDIHWSDGVASDGMHKEQGQRRRIVMPGGWDVGAIWEQTWHGIPYHYRHPDDLRGKTRWRPSPRSLRNPVARVARFGLDFSSTEEAMHYPFAGLSPLFGAADIAFANLETPLSARGRRIGHMFRAPGSFADALKAAGIDIVSTANNHALDAGAVGLSDTLANLERVGIAAVGSGATLGQARAPHLIERNGIRFAFLAYAAFENSGLAGFALDNRSGVAPMDPYLIREDIAAVRPSVDFVILSFHWGRENRHDVHPVGRTFARDMIDAGADIILGHHPHVIRGIEVYRGKVILHSLGNTIFGYANQRWSDNYLARLTFSRKQIEKVEILPIAGRGVELAQPFLLDGVRRDLVLLDTQDRSRQLNTAMTVSDGAGIIVPATAALADPDDDGDGDLSRYRLPTTYIVASAVVLLAGAAIAVLVVRWGWRRVRRRFRA